MRGLKLQHHPSIPPSRRKKEGGVVGVDGGGRKGGEFGGIIMGDFWGEFQEKVGGKHIRRGQTVNIASGKLKNMNLIVTRRILEIPRSLHDKALE